MDNKNLNYYLADALKDGQAIGHFNFATEDVARAIVQGAKDAGAKTVVLGTSEGEADFFGMPEAVAVVRAMSQHFDFPVFLNADHFRSFEKCKEAIDSGYDSVIIDPKNESYEEKVLTTKEVVEYAKTKSPDISVEGELGYLKGSSELQKKIEISSADYTKPEQAKDFIEKTGINRLAVVFGNFHGIATEQEEHLDIEHFKKLVSAIPNMYFVLHGASGVGDGEIKTAIKAGISHIHFNTELRIAYHDAIQKILSEKPGETTPYKYLGFGAEEVKKIVFHKTRLFNGQL